MTRSIDHRSALVLLLATVFACGDSPKDPNTTDQVTTDGTSTAAPTATQEPVATATATAEPTATAPPKPKGPGPVGAFVPGNAKAAKPGTKLAVPIKPEDEAALRAKLDAAVEKNGEGTAFDGSPAAGRFKGGDVIELTITLQPNKCYTVVAVSNEGITELDASVVVAAPVPGIPAQTVASDTTTGADSTIGGGANCVKNPLPVAGPATVQVKATKGAGTAAFQVLSK